MLMKLRNLLVLGALLISGSVWAERQKPVLTDYPVETIEIDGKSEYYMYNAGAKKFWVGANAWGTQASVGPTGWKVRFSQYTTGGKEWDRLPVRSDTDPVQWHSRGQSGGSTARCRHPERPYGCGPWRGPAETPDNNRRHRRSG